MNKNIFDTNLNVGPNTVVEAGTITKLEINGEDIPIDKGITMYGWSNDDGADTVYGYSFTPNPKVGDTMVMNDAATGSLDDDPVSAVADDTVTAFSTEFTRDETKDIVIR